MGKTEQSIYETTSQNGQAESIQQQSQDTLLLTLDSVVDPATSTTEQPPAGERFVGVVFTVKNTGADPISAASTSNDVIVGLKGTTGARNILGNAPASVQCPGSPSFDVQPGESVQTCATFVIYDSEQVVALYWTWSKGADYEGGKWFLSES
jgi:archaellum component FlaG (FlaF/FlaG flagellin family)